MLSNQSISLLTNVDSLELLRNTPELVIELSATIPDIELEQFLFELQCNCNFTTLKYHFKFWNVHEQALMQRVTCARDNILLRLISFSVVGLIDIRDCTTQSDAPEAEEMIETIRLLTDVMTTHLRLDNLEKVELDISFKPDYGYAEEDDLDDSQFPFDVLVDFLCALPQPNKLKHLLINIPYMPYVFRREQWSGADYDNQELNEGESMLPH